VKCEFRGNGEKNRLLTVMVNTYQELVQDNTTSIYVTHQRQDSCEIENLVESILDHVSSDTQTLCLDTPNIREQDLENNQTLDHSH
jgi:hypothetical protein